MGKDLQGRELGRGLSQRKDGRYEARSFKNGIKIDVYGKTLKEVKKAYTLALSNANNKPKKAGITLSEWFEDWFDNYKKPSMKNAQSYLACRNRCRYTFLKLLGDKILSDISQRDLQIAVNQLLGQGVSHYSISAAYGTMKSCFESARDNNLIANTPCNGIIIRGNNSKRQRRVLTQEEQHVFLEEAKNSFYYELYQILLLTGMRIGEAAALQWEDIDFKNKVIRVQRSMIICYFNGHKVNEFTAPKTQNSYREIPFFEGTEQCFKNWREKKERTRKERGDKWHTPQKFGDLVFTTSYGNPISRYNIADNINVIVGKINRKEEKVARKEGRQPEYFEHIHPHTFRHTFATRLFESGVNPVFVQSVMGHSNYSVTLSYTHVLEDVKRKEVEKAGDILFGIG